MPYKAWKINENFNIRVLMLIDGESFGLLEEDPAGKWLPGSRPQLPDKSVNITLE